MTRLLALLCLLLPSVANAQLCNVKGTGPTGIYSGSGVCIGADAQGRSLILTASHVISECNEVSIGQWGRWHRCEVLKTTGVKPNTPHSEPDLALLAITDGLKMKHRAVGEQAPQAGDAVYVNGFRSGEGHAFRARRANVLSNDRVFLRFNIPCVDGESGGAVTHNGRVVGIISSTGPDSATATGLEAIQQFVGKVDATFVDARNGDRRLKIKSNVVMYHFSAPWCGPCQLMEPICRRLKESGMKMEDINTDTRTGEQIAEQMGIKSIPAFVVVADGKPVDKIARACTEGELRRLYEKYAVDRNNPDCAKPAPAPPPEESPPQPIPDPISTPQPPEKPPEAPPAPDLSNIQGQLDALFVRVEVIEKRQPRDGKDGAPGKDGADGQPGRDGKDADCDALLIQIQELQAAVGRLQQKELPPVVIRFVDPDTGVPLGPDRAFKLGEAIPFYNRTHTKE